MSKFIKIKTWDTKRDVEFDTLINVDNITEVKHLGNGYILIYFGMNRWTNANMSLDDFYKLIDNRYAR